MAKKPEFRGWLRTASKVASWIGATAKAVLNKQTKPEEHTVEFKQLSDTVVETLINEPALDDFENAGKESGSTEKETFVHKVRTHVQPISQVINKNFAEIPIAFVPVLTILAKQIPDPQLMQIAEYLDKLAETKKDHYALDLHAAAEWLGYYAERRMRGLIR